MKKIKTYSLDESVIEFIHSEAIKDDRSDSDYLNRLIKQSIKSVNKPIKDIVAKTPKFNFKSELLNLGVSEQTAKDWLEVRRKKKAANTQTAFNRLVKQINISGLTAQQAAEMAAAKSWSGFDAEWVKKETQDFSDTSTDWVNQNHGIII